MLCGVQSSDAVDAATGVALAAHLGLARVAVVRGVEHDAAAGALTVERELEGGSIEVLRVGLPALLTIQTGINEPRYATLRAIKQAREKPLDVVEPASWGSTPTRSARPSAPGGADCGCRSAARARRCSPARRRAGRADPRDRRRRGWR